MNHLQTHLDQPTTNLMTNLKCNGGATLAILDNLDNLLPIVPFFSPLKAPFFTPFLLIRLVRLVRLVKDSKRAAFRMTNPPFRGWPRLANSDFSPFCEVIS